MRSGPPRHLYGQFLLDELLVSELLGGTEWWGNTAARRLALDHEMGRMAPEGSAVRPWTYSHYTPTRAYLKPDPLGPPLGAASSKAASIATRQDSGQSRRG